MKLYEQISDVGGHGRRPRHDVMIPSNHDVSDHDVMIHLHWHEISLLQITPNFDFYPNLTPTIEINYCHLELKM